MTHHSSLRPDAALIAVDALRSLFRAFRECVNPPAVAPSCC
jgi:hypothetical protein